MTTQPSKQDIEAVFQRLRAIPANKTCFDCNAKIPTWASITYGVFICIDCSAVHRGLGVHLTFVRSTQLDTNWTWMQLRQMQVGGNANALQFFLQHNCDTNDSQKKYNSRAAQLYREKLNQLALKAMQNNSQLHIHPNVEEKEEEKEIDFFSDHDNFISSKPTSVDVPKNENSRLQTNTTLPEEGPKVDFNMTLSNTGEHKSTIGVRKVQAKKLGLGTKKGGLGATKVKTNFADLEREATLAEESRLRMQEENAKAAAVSAQEQEERDAAVRLAYKDLGIEQQKREEQLKKVDPRRAEQMERLGMGFHTKSGVSHSVLNDMQTIEQENLHTGNLTSLSKLRLSDTDSFFDDYSYGSGFSMNRNSNTSFNMANDSFFTDSGSSKDSWVVVDDPPADFSKNKSRPVERTPTRKHDVDNSDIAQKKFGSAKAISSDQFFTDRNNDYEHQSNLSRFQGSSSISSSEYFGDTKENVAGTKFQTPDLEDVRESVRQGVTKVAGKISSLANGVMSSIQERYGY